MDTIAGMRTTGRLLRGPASDLVELDGANGLRHTAIQFHDAYRDHNAINDALEVVRHYLQSPMVTGMIELVDIDHEHGAYVYPTGQCWSVAEIIRLLADMGETAGVRAGLELMYAAGQILVEAADTGEAEGVYSHGGLTPWRIVLRKDGQVMIIGYALPQCEILEFHADPERVPREDSFRYCPPERMEAAPEDITSDLFGLSLIAFELMTGKPVYDGLVDDIRQQAARGEGSRRLFRFRDALPGPVRELLVRALKPSVDHRYPSGDDYLDAVRDVLRGPNAPGPSLVDVMSRIANRAQRVGSRPESASTMMGTAEDFRKLLDSDEGDVAAEAGPARQAFAPPPRRSARRAPAPEAAPEPAPAPVSTPDPEPPVPASGRPRRVSRAPRRTTGAPAGGDADASLLASLRASLATSRSDVLDAPAPAPAAEPAPPPPPPAMPSSRVSSAPRRAPRRPALGDNPFAGGIEGLSPAPVDADRPAPHLPTPEPAPPPRAAPQPPAVPERVAAAPPAPRPRRSTPTAEEVLRRIRRSGDEPRPAPPPPPPVRGASEPLGLEPLVLDEETGRAPRDRFRSPASGPLPVSAGPASAGFGSGPPPRFADAADNSVALPHPEPLKSTAPRALGPGSSAAGPVAALASSPAVPAVPAVTAPRIDASFEGDTSFAGAVSLTRPPDPIRAPGGGGAAHTLSLRRGRAGRSIRVKVPAGQPFSEVVATLVGSRLPIPTDLTGAVSGWYRVELDGVRLDPDARADSVPAGSELRLVHVRNTVVQADVAVEGGPTPARFVAPVGTAVPVASLVDHLSAWLDLPPGDWHLRLGDTPLSPYAILADAPLGGLPRLRLVPGRMTASASGAGAS